MLFGILLASLKGYTSAFMCAGFASSDKKHKKVNQAYLGWLANLLPNHFPFVRFIFFDSIE
jgi:hypothetical protein